MLLSFVLFGSRLRGVLGAWWSRWFGCLFFLPVVSLACWGSAWGFARVLPWLVLWVLLLWSAVLLGLSLVGVVALVLSRVCFVRFARPRFRPVSGVSGRWVCVSVSSLPGVRLGRFVWAVRPAVVARRSGVVSFVWVWVSAPNPNDTTTAPTSTPAPILATEGQIPLAPCGLCGGGKPPPFLQIRLTYQNNCDKLIVGSTAWR